MIQRLILVRELLHSLGADALLVTDPTNLFYLTGLSLSCGQLLVYRAGALLLVDGRYYEMAHSCQGVKLYASEKVALPKILQDSAFESIRVIAVDEETTSYGAFIQLRNSFAEAEAGAAVEGGVRSAKILLPVANPVKVLRARKSEEEIALLRRAAALCSSGFDYVCKSLRQGVSEEELASELEIFWKRQGGSGLSFEPIIAFGANSSMPHYRSGARCLRHGDIVLIDIGVKFQHYHSDMTRTVFFGEPAPQLMEIYNVVAAAQDAALVLCRPGVTAGQLDAAARAVIAEHGFADFFPHSLGHGVGLEIHEAPVLRNKEPHASVFLQEGMVITIEPGIYLPGVGGVRLEDCIVITSDGYENLTNRPAIPARNF